MTTAGHFEFDNTAALARRLPDEFLEAPGLPVQRALLLAHRHWPSRTEPELRQLAQLLLLTLEPLLKRTPAYVPASIRDTCEHMVRDWNTQSSGRDGGSPK